MRELIFSCTKKDFRIDWFSGRGAGGQHRNKHQNCCRITHIATGMTATGQIHRERPRNQKEAFTKLANMLVSRFVRDEKRARYGNQETIRTYHEPDNRVKDMASGFQQPYKHVVGKPDLSDMIVNRAAAAQEKAGEHCGPYRRR